MKVSSLRASATSSNTLHAQEAGGVGTGHPSSQPTVGCKPPGQPAASNTARCPSHLRMKRRPPSSTMPRPPSVLSAVGPSCCSSEMVSAPSSSAASRQRGHHQRASSTCVRQRGPRLPHYSPVSHGVVASAPAAPHPSCCPPPAAAAPGRARWQCLAAAGYPAWPAQTSCPARPARAAAGAQRLRRRGRGRRR